MSVEMTNQSGTLEVASAQPQSWRDLFDWRPKCSAPLLSLLVSGYLLLVLNLSFWQHVTNIAETSGGWGASLYLSLFVLLLGLFNLLLMLCSFGYFYKPVLIAMLLTAASSAYFMDSYGVMIDRTMILNMLETDQTEVLDLISFKMLFYWLVLGGLPAWLVFKTELASYRWLGALLRHVAAFFISGLLIVLTILLSYQDFASLFRNNRELRYLINPFSSIYATVTLSKQMLVTQTPTELKTIAADAKRVSTAVLANRPKVTVLVVGETARAENFSLDGYRRLTNPMLADQQNLFYASMKACGTSTAVSVPCMFSLLTQQDYSAGEAKSQQNLLDVLIRTGIDVYWRNNNSGCKGVCQRVPTEDLRALALPEVCEREHCYDAVLLHQLPEMIEAATDDLVLVLHMNGSHGPAYYKRYPKSFERFTPVCETNQLQNCSAEQIKNTYDNSILYTDFVIAELIDLLRSYQDRFDTSMLYLSDHGESLGENNIFLHGTPYMFAPEQQTRVPMLLWLSDSFQQNQQVSLDCIANQNLQSLSQDYLFHTLLSLMSVSTGVYQPQLDLLNGCRTPVYAESREANHG